MIEANELRIGNWLDDGFGKQIQVDFEVLSNFYFAVMRHYKPIPLTEDWLIKFGFELMKVYYTCYSTSYPMPYMVIDKSNQVISINELTGDITNIGEPLKYVHKLQNLYFALTGEELTIKELANTN